MNRNVPIRWGFIGCGQATELKMLPAFTELADAEVVAVMSRNGLRARAFAERHKIAHWYADAQNLVNDPAVDAVYIATPPSTHAIFAIMALKAGKAVYVEKPLATSYADCLRINHISAEVRRPCFVAYYRRYLPYFDRVRQLLAEGTIGKVLSAQIRFAVPPRDLDYSSKDLPWRLQPDIAGGGYFYDLAPHQLDLLQQLFGPIVEATGYTANRGGLYPTEDTVSAAFGALWRTKARKKTEYSSLATAAKSLFPFSPMLPSMFSVNVASVTWLSKIRSMFKSHCCVKSWDISKDIQFAPAMR